MSTTPQLVLYERRDRVAVITLNRPEKRNALSRAMWVQIDEAFLQADADPEVRAIVLAANGPVFCAGADIAGGEDPTEPRAWLEFHQKHHRRQFAMWASTKVIVAALQGSAIGRGLELALWCDMIVAGEDAKLGQPEVREGWVLWSVVPWLAGPQKAKLFMMGGDMISAREAEGMNLVTRVVAPGTAKEEAIRLATRLTHVPPIAMRTVKHMVNATYETMGIRSQQAAGAAMSAVAAVMSDEERETVELERVRREQGFKASIRWRDEPFER